MSDAELRALLRDYERSLDPALLEQASRLARRSGLTLPAELLDGAVLAPSSFRSDLDLRVWALVPDLDPLEVEVELSRQRDPTRLLNCPAPEVPGVARFEVGSTPNLLELPERYLSWVEVGRRRGGQPRHSLSEVLSALREQGGEGLALDWQFHGQDLSALAELEQLRFVGASGEHGLELLESLPPSLRCLRLFNPRLLDADLAELARLPELTWLSVSGVRFGGGAFAELARLPVLTRLAAQHLTLETGLEPADLAGAPALRRLRVGPCACAALAPLQQLTHLDFLAYDSALEALAPLQQLTHLTLTFYSFREGGITPARVADLARSLPRLQVLDLRHGVQGQTRGWARRKYRRELIRLMPEGVELLL
ncbi:MAG TPA: hypothetical protein DEA08_18790 [Planctomycetes bacterium]|nr:hypothetical protein [Planctomycetota bacterium]